MKPQSCDWGKDKCRHSVENAGEAASKCVLCRLAPDNRYTKLPSHWVPLPDFRSKPHPLLKAEKDLDRRERQAKNHQNRLSKDKTRKKLLKKAVKAEESTEAAFKNNRNSGRLNKDGDHQIAGISLDTKLQSTRENPIVHIHELEKINKDALRAGNQMGALVLRNKHGYGVVAMEEQTFVRLVSALMNINIATNAIESRCDGEVD